MMFACLPAHAADDVVMLPITDALTQARVDEKLDGSVKFYFADQPSPIVVQRLGLFVVNPKNQCFCQR